MATFPPCNAFMRVTSFFSVFLKLNIWTHKSKDIQKILLNTYIFFSTFYLIFVHAFTLFLFQVVSIFYIFFKSSTPLWVVSISHHFLFWPYIGAHFSLISLTILVKENQLFAISSWFVGIFCEIYLSYTVIYSDCLKMASM